MSERLEFVAFMPSVGACDGEAVDLDWRPALEWPDRWDRLHAWARDRGFPMRTVFRPEWVDWYEDGLRRVSLGYEEWARTENGMDAKVKETLTERQERIEAEHRAANAWTFEDGAVVELRSGSTPMTVAVSMHTRGGTEFVECSWMVNGEVRVEQFRATELKRVTG